MGCPILLGFAEACTGTTRREEQIRFRLEARAVPDPFRGTLEHRANVALRIIISKLLKDALVRSEMKNDIAWLDDVPDDLDVAKTREVFERIKDRAIAWKLQHTILPSTEGELELVFTQRVWEIVDIADILMHDMAQGSYTTAGLALGRCLQKLELNIIHWVSMFEQLKEVT